ncbi:hypothetical protein IDH08_06380 [Pelagibacterales bacterium SAG-MED22]|nr:hypothetical protein [Pelagibacterales bacterium SAG-MED22]
MIPHKVIDHLDEYISQEIYVQIAVIKGKEKVSTELAINKYFSSNHFKDLVEGRPYDHFIEGLRDKCLGKLKNSPMRNKQTDDPTIIELQNKLNKLSDEELDNTYWEIETGEFFTGEQIKELEEMRNNLISKLISRENSKQDSVFKIIMGFCETYEKLCQKKYPEAPLPLEILKSVN